MTTHVQALILSKEYFNKRQAESWIRRHKQFKPLKMHETLKTYRFRLRQPDERFEYRTKPFSMGVKAVIRIPYTAMIY